MPETLSPEYNQLLQATSKVKFYTKAKPNSILYRVEPNLYPIYESKLGVISGNAFTQSSADSTQIKVLL